MIENSSMKNREAAIANSTTALPRCSRIDGCERLLALVSIELHDAFI